MALMPAPKPLAGSLTRQPRKFPTNPSPAAAAALANVGRTPPVKPLIDKNIGRIPAPAPAGDAAMRAAASVAEVKKPVAAAVGRLRGLGAAIKA